MRYLVVFYSRTGNTKKVAERIAEMLNCDIEEIIDIKNRNGIIGFLRSGYEAVRRKLTVIAKTKYNPSDYDIVIVGTPVWAGRISVPIRTYITMNREKFNKLACFCTLKMKNAPMVFKEIRDICQKDPLFTLTIRASEINSGTYIKKVEEFVLKLQHS